MSASQKLWHPFRVHVFLFISFRWCRSLRELNHRLTDWQASGLREVVRAEAQRSSVPMGRAAWRQRNPALKCRAIFSRSSGTMGLRVEVSP